MMGNRQGLARKISGKKGFTLIELIWAVAIMFIIGAIATPSIIQLRQSLFFRQVTRDVASMLRDARNRAIATNLQHQVVLDIDTAQDQYMLQRGNASVGSAVWTLAKNWVPVPQGIAIGQDAANAAACVNADINIVFNPNGTAINPIVAGTPVPICIQNAAGVAIYQVTVNPITGGVTMSQRLN
ncbi:MAG: prepilin-type N-terminal cleavage/methylation domain-containing protein [Nitrospira sp.]|nr:prepilin-type N-terminal cleavage/methylation domain-containing protein [Nitrospira sp.]